MTWFKRGDARYESNEEHLREELERVAGLLRAQLFRFQSADPEPHRERFWHLTDEYLESLGGDDEHSPLALFEPAAEEQRLIEWVSTRRKEIDARLAATPNCDLRLKRLATEFQLSSEETDTLLVALLPSLHSRYRRWFGVLQYDAARCQATVGLIIEMLANSAEDMARLFARLMPGSTLAAGRLLVLTGGEDEPLATRSTFVDDRITSFLFGVDEMDARAATNAQWFDEPVQLSALPLSSENAIRLEMLPNLRAAEPGLLPRLRIRFTGPDRRLAVQAMSTVVTGLHQRLLVIDCESASTTRLSWRLLVDLVLREARLAGGIPIFTGVSRLLELPEHRHWLDQLINRLADFPHPAAIEMGDPEGYWPTAGDWIPFHLEAPTLEMRERLWTQLMESEPNSVAEMRRVVRTIARSFQLTGSQIGDAWRAAHGLARRRNVFIDLVDENDLFSACRQQSAERLVAFAQRIEPRRDLKLERDIVLPPASMRLLGELRARIRNYRRVHSAMELGDHMRLGRGVTALFVGGSGTGKTMAAEVLASEQQIDLYRIDLAAVMSKWVGETEKNLGRIFADAERANCMLFFDEADSIFGRRGEVKEAQQHWVNLQIGYLLQRIEEYSGVVILATNLRQNIDEAFARRIHMVVEFTPPDAASRRAIWERLLPTGEHRSVSPEDLDEFAQRFDFTGGDIRNVVLDACYRALAEEGDASVTTRHLAASTAREFQKAGRPVMHGEFGRFYEWAMQDVVAPANAASSR